MDFFAWVEILEFFFMESLRSICAAQICFENWWKSKVEIWENFVSEVGWIFLHGSKFWFFFSWKVCAPFALLKYALKIGESQKLKFTEIWENFVSEVRWIFLHGSKILVFCFMESLRSICAAQICFKNWWKSKVGIYRNLRKFCK